MLQYNHIPPLRSGVTRISCVALATALLVLLAACQGGSTGSTDQVRLLITPVPTPTATEAAQPTAAPVTYTVKSGDTLSGIADLFGVTVDDIVRSNNVADANSLQVGQTLTIPRRQAGAAATAGGTGTPGTPGAGGISGTQTPGTNPATVSTITPVLVSPTVLPPDATPPQGPTIQEPQAGGISSASPGNSPTSGP